ncbi:MAG TPA: lysylphosphatidylglycerol synthase transmembrane domain-containing protein [Mycobacteriales bacterium]|jgi:uncharacterized membrane protein YbhN (UPF0104 family)|nr:lysylphosphatidylglycerol synthase transmembrane domain-containing protein [Mycobacteriales bacterium]
MTAVIEDARPDQRGRSRPGVRPALAVLVAAAVGVLLFRQRVALDAGADGLAHADLRWLAAAAAGTVLMWTAGTVAAAGSIPCRIPLLRLFAVQVGGTFANHVLPAGSGGITVNVRFLRRCGLSRPAAFGAVGLNMLAGVVGHTALLVGAVVLAPRSLAVYPHGAPPGWTLLALTAAVALVALAGWLGRGRWLPALRRLRDQLAELAVVARTPTRAAQLWIGSVAAPVLHCAVLFAVLHAVGGTVGLLPVTIAYLLASSASALLPSPGGFGSLDVALVAALVAVGQPATVALAAVLAYRLITVWIPLLPGACVLAVLIRRKVV